MRILHVIPAMGTVYGGPSKSLQELAESLAICGVEIDIVTTNANGSNVLDVPTQTWIEEKGYRIQYFSCWYLNDYKVSISMAKWLFQNIRDYDVVNTHAIFSLSILPAYWACQLYKVPYIIHPHGMLEDWTLAYKKWKKSFYYELIEKPALQRASKVRVLASAEGESIQRLGVKTPLTLVPNGIWQKDFAELPDLQEFYQRFPETRGKTLILFLGRIDPKKGLDLLASAFAKVHNLFPQTHLVVAGPDNMNFLPIVKEYFVQAKCFDAVTFTGMLSGYLKSAVLTAANLYVAPSYSEGFSMSILEGMAAALPCVITIGCNFPEAANAGAAHVVGIDSEYIADALIDYLKNPQQAKVMGEIARQLVFEKYTWEKIAINLTHTYKTIIFEQDNHNLTSVP
ncbi:MAG: glycosyltransferase [Scytonematopsis contorta HA4267-MV1]|jgi:glycosyltransferase involved in cell wall biosynthesis|nr:glycosyltransferase [Scytonematopsis contorta HA4267-MV1]